MRTHYDNLHVSEKASPEVIRGAYKALAQKWHPDKHPEQREKAERYFKIINRAFEILSDPKLRGEYDAWLVGRRSAETAPPEVEPADEPQKQSQYQRKNMAEARADGKRSREKGFAEKDCPYGGDLAEAWREGFAASEPVSHGAVGSLVGRLWRGELGLAKTFWLYGIVGLSLVSMASFLLGAALADDSNDVERIIRFSQNFYISYFIFISICTFRSFLRALRAPSDSRAYAEHKGKSGYGEPDRNRAAVSQAPLVSRLLAGEVQARYIIIFGSLFPIMAISALFRLAFEKPDYDEMVVRIYILCAPPLLSFAYIIWSALKLGDGPRKRAIVGVAASAGLFVFLVAASF